MSDCVFIKETQNRAVCQICGAIVTTHFPAEKIHRKCSNITPKKGPGNDLKAILRAMGFTYNFGCGCDDFVGLMNYHGLEWCKKHRKFIAERLAGNATKAGHSKLVNNPLTIQSLLTLSFSVSALKALANTS